MMLCLIPLIPIVLIGFPVVTRSSHVGSSPNDLVRVSPNVNQSLSNALKRLYTPSQGGSSPTQDGYQNKASRSYRSLGAAFTEPLGQALASMSNAPSFGNLEGLSSHQGLMDESPNCKKLSPSPPAAAGRGLTFGNLLGVEVNLPLLAPRSNPDHDGPQAFVGPPRPPPISSMIHQKPDPLTPSKSNANSIHGPRQRLSSMRRSRSCPPSIQPLSKKSGRQTLSKDLSQRKNQAQYVNDLRRKIQSDIAGCREKWALLGKKMTPKRNRSCSQSQDGQSVYSIERELELKEEFDRTVAMFEGQFARMQEWADADPYSIPMERRDGSTHTVFQSSPLTPDTVAKKATSPETAIHYKVSPLLERHCPLTTPGSNSRQMPSESTGTIGLHRSSSSKSGRHKSFKLPKPITPSDDMNSGGLHPLNQRAVEDAASLWGSTQKAQTLQIFNSSRGGADSISKGGITRLLDLGTVTQRTHTELEKVPDDQSSTLSPSPSNDEQTIAVIDSRDDSANSSTPNPPHHPEVQMNPPVPPHSTTPTHFAEQKENPFVKYMWVIVALGTTLVVLLLVVSIVLITKKNIQCTSCCYRSESMKQHQISMPQQEQLKAGKSMNVGMRFQKSWSSTFGSWTVMIEQTISNDAPCKSWMLCDKIGSGRFGEVRLAVDPTVVGDRMHSLRQPKYYAVKRAKFSTDKLDPNDEVLSIFHEIVMISQLRHPNIVRYYGNGVANEHICLFLEWCRIGSMADILVIRKSFSIPRIHHYLSNLLDAISLVSIDRSSSAILFECPVGLTLTTISNFSCIHVHVTGFLHSKRIYHRDIKGRNILLCGDGTCKLADFGSAVDISDHHRRFNVDSIKPAGTSSVHISAFSFPTHCILNIQSIVFSHSVHWWPPETFNHSHQSLDELEGHDIWSLGVTTIEMINELPPYHQLSIKVLSVLMQSSPHSYHTQIPVTHDINLNDFIRSCLTIKCQKRPSVIQLLSHKFILEGPQKNDLIAAHTNSNEVFPSRTADVGISECLRKRELEAQNYADELTRNNIHLWPTAKFHRNKMLETRQSRSQSPSRSEPEGEGTMTMI